MKQSAVKSIPESDLVRHRSEKSPHPGRQRLDPQPASDLATTLTEDAYRRLEEMIVTLELPPDEAVSEAILSRRIGIGTTPIREALLRLAQERLVRIIPRRGVVISPIDVRQQLEVLETRRELDRLLARVAARRGTAAERRAIGELVTLTERAVERKDLREFLRLDAQLNSSLAKAARNTIAAETVVALHAVSRRFWFYHLNDERDFTATARLHVEVIRAVAKGDESLAAEASDRLIDHLVEFANATLPKA